MEEKRLIEHIRRLGKLPDDIAENSALLENLFSLFVAVFARIPIFICGKPGSSKSLAVDILTNTFNDNSSKQSFYRGFADLNQNYFQGSKQTTDKGIEKVFQKALHRSDSPKQIQLVFIDELGLAELSPHNPLKVLHKYLDSTSHSKTRPAGDSQRNRQDIAFIGISNWDIDASKQNRHLYVARMDLEENDLIETAKNIIRIGSDQRNANDFQKSENFEVVSKVFSKSYVRFRKKQEEDFAHPNFHTLRDFYWMIKIFADSFYEGTTSAKTLARHIKTAIDTNFSGLYQKIAQNKTVGSRDLEEVDQVLKNKTNLKLHSNFLMKQLFGKELRAHGQTNWDFKSQIKEDSSVMDHLLRGINLDFRRYLMVFIDWEVTQEMLIRRIKKSTQSHDNSKRIIILAGSSFRFDRQSADYLQDKLNMFKYYVTNGFIVIMKDLEPIYPNLYDLFNQRFILSGSEFRYCNITFENRSEILRIHKDFRCLIIKKESDLFAESADLEAKLPSPLMNRFEKHILNLHHLQKTSRCGSNGRHRQHHRRSARAFGAHARKRHAQNRRDENQLHVLLQPVHLLLQSW